MSDETDDSPEQKVITVTATRGGVYHTDPDCPHYPDDTRPITDADRRRGIRACTDCAGRMIGPSPEEGDG